MTDSPAIDHVALVVADLARTEQVYRSLGFDVAYRERVDDQGVDIIGMRAGDAIIELLKPLSSDSPLVRFLGGKATRLHHIAYRVGNIDEELDRLRRLGMKLIDERPRRGANGNRIAFIHPSSTGGTLIEACERAK